MSKVTWEKKQKVLRVRKNVERYDRENLEGTRHLEDDYYFNYM